MSAMTAIDLPKTFRASGELTRTRLARAEHRSGSRDERQSESYSALTYWLVFKPIVATWISLIPYGFATCLLELTARQSMFVEMAAGALWLAVMAFWPNPTAKRTNRAVQPIGYPKILRPVRANLVPVGTDSVPDMLHAAYERPRIAMAVIREKVTCLVFGHSSGCVRSLAP